MPLIEGIAENFHDHFKAWVRLEPRCRSNNFARGLEARTADPLWMLARQWQTGEFQGEDAGSPIEVHLTHSTQSIERMRLENSDTVVDLPSAPLEAMVEQERFAMDWRARVQIGQQFERFARSPDLGINGSSLIAAYRTSFPLDRPTDEDWVKTDRSTRRFIALMVGRVIDGNALIDDIKQFIDTVHYDHLRLQVPMDDAQLIQAFDLLLQLADTWEKKVKRALKQVRSALSEGRLISPDGMANTQVLWAMEQIKTAIEGDQLLPPIESRLSDAQINQALGQLWRAAKQGKLLADNVVPIAQQDEPLSKLMNSIGQDQILLVDGMTLTQLMAILDQMIVRLHEGNPIVVMAQLTDAELIQILGQLGQTVSSNQLPAASDTTMTNAQLKNALAQLKLAIEKGQLIQRFDYGMTEGHLDQALNQIKLAIDQDRLKVSSSLSEGQLVQILTDIMTFIKQGRLVQPLGMTNSQLIRALTQIKGDISSGQLQSTPTATYPFLNNGVAHLTQAIEKAGELSPPPTPMTDTELIQGLRKLIDIMDLGNLKPPAGITNDQLARLFVRFFKWYARLHLQPREVKSEAWRKHQLGYRFELNPPVGPAAPDPQTDKTRLQALDYRNGALDWYSFHASDIRGHNGKHWTQHDPVKTHPARITIGGTSPRWWAFEDAAMDFGKLDVAKPDLAKLMLMEFVLIYGDDWFSVPLPIKMSNLVRIDELEVSNVFGEKEILKPARIRHNKPMLRWELFTLSPIAENGQVNSLTSNSTGVGNGDVLFIPPVAGFREESPPIEEVRFLRDEGANMVWGIEHIVPNGLGRPIDGFDAQRERIDRQHEAEIARLEQEIAKIEQEFAAGNLSDEDPQIQIGKKQKKIAILKEGPKPSSGGIPRYRLATTVPENWIPFTPTNEQRFFDVNYNAIRLNRAQMLRNTDDEVPRTIPAMSRLLELSEDPLLWLEESAVPRSGLRVQLTKQRIRWVDGKTYVWSGRKVLTGKGEGSSGLRFDSISSSESDVTNGS